MFLLKDMIWKNNCDVDRFCRSPKAKSNIQSGHIILKILTSQNFSAPGPKGPLDPLQRCTACQFSGPPKTLKNAKYCLRKRIQ